MRVARDIYKMNKGGKAGDRKSSDLNSQSDNSFQSNNSNNRCFAVKNPTYLPFYSDQKVNPTTVSTVSTEKI